MSTIDHITERFKEVQSLNGSSRLSTIEQNAFESFQKQGLPTSKHEEWKYTRVAALFNKDFKTLPGELTAKDIDGIRCPGHEEANELVFVNGIFSESLSKIISADLLVQSLETASQNEYSDIISKHLGNSSRYVKDGIQALNTAFVQQGLFVHIKKGRTLEQPTYIYHINDARVENMFAQPRILIHLGMNAQAAFVVFTRTMGSAESFTSAVTEVVLEKDARVDFYTIQDDAAHASQVNTLHFRQLDPSYIHAVTVSLNGSLVRNNLNIALEAEHSEAHLYGLYFLKGKTHVDNHTVVDHRQPNCPSNELYKGIIDEQATAVFNGKIFVQPQAQKTNAYQSNKNILLSGEATVNTKPQLEIFADDVKCSHGCTVGQLDEEGLFYLQSRGIPEKMARALLVHSFAMDILEHIHLPLIREFVDELIENRLDIQQA